MSYKSSRVPETVLDQSRAYRTTPVFAPEAKRSRLNYAPMLGAIILAALLDTLGARPERIRERLLLGRREVDASVVAQLPVRLG